MDILDSQKSVLEFLINSKKQNRLSHAYMFEGPKGVGKLETALYFIAMMWCEKDKPCLTCNTCKQILNKQFVNLIYISPEKNNISVEEINKLQKEFSSTAVLEGPRFYIIDDADKMQSKVQNRLLKFIEEPVSDQTFGILLTSNSDSIITTIKSRVISLTLNELSYDFLVKKLEGKVDDKYLNILPHIENSVEKCLNILEDKNKVNIINYVYSFIDELNTRDISLFFNKNINLFNNKDLTKTENTNNMILFINLVQELYKDIYKTMIHEAPITFKNVDFSTLTTLYKLSYISEISNELVEFEHKLRYNININLQVIKLITVLNGGVIR